MNEREKARQAFKASGLDAELLTDWDMERLATCCIIAVEQTGNSYIQRAYYNDKTKNKGVLVDGAYFKGREGITFNDDGFIGFCGWADDDNTAVILQGFYNWLTIKTASKFIHKKEG